VKASGPKSEQKRFDILISAAAVFRRRGYHGASVEQIASALGMTKGNLYYYFKNKEEILYVCHDYSLDLILEHLENVHKSDDPPEKKVHRLVVGFVHLYIDVLRGTAWTLEVDALSPSHRKKIIAKRDRVDRGFRAILLEGMDSGVFAPADPKLLTFAIVGAINWIPRWFDPAGSASAEDIATQFADYLVAGLLASAAAPLRAAASPRRPLASFAPPA
jgi:TetR/AcrR family transcriptional regulator